MTNREAYIGRGKGDRLAVGGGEGEKTACVQTLTASADLAA